MERAIGVIRKVGSQWCIFSKDGSKKLGCFSSEKKAKERLAQIEYFKGTSMSSLEQTIKSHSIFGTLAGQLSDRVLDGKDHFPISNEDQARSAVHRLMDLNDVPDWFKGDAKALKTIVLGNIKQKYPTLKVSRPLNLEAAIAASIQNPVPAEPKKVKDIPTPNLELTGNKNDIKLILETKAACKIFATNLMEMLDKKKTHIDKAIKLAGELEKSGLTKEQFSQLHQYLQEDVLMSLMSSSAAAYRKELIERMNK